jgi:signal transduction histidine kinase
MRSIILICSIFIAANAYAQSQQLQFSVLHFTDEHGLPQNSVKFIAEGGDGFMWMTTEDGVVRFDGRQFLTFNGNIGLKNSRIQHMFPGIKGNSLMARSIDAEQIVMRNGRAFLEPQTRDYSYIFNNDTTRSFPILGFRKYLKDAEANHYLVPVNPVSYYKITKDTIRYMENGKEQYRLRYQEVNPEKLMILDNRLCYMDADGRFLLFDSRGIHPLQIEGDLPALQPGPGAGNKRGVIWNFAAAQQFVYTDKSCYRIQLVNPTTIRLTLVLEGFDMDGMGVVTVYHDKVHKRVFLGTFTKGLFVCTEKQFRALKTGRNGEEIFYGQTSLGKDSIVAPGGIIFHGRNQPGRSSLPDSVWSNDKYSITKDGSGNYWYKSYRRLFKLDHRLTTVLWSGVINNDNDDQIGCLYAGKDGRLWIGAKYSGLYFLETSASRPEMRVFMPELKGISYILDDRNVLWVGTLKGLFRVDLSRRKIDTIRGLESFYIRSLFIPRPGEVWVTTYNNGVFLYRNGKLTNLPEDPQKYLATAHCIVPDGRGFLWITTNKGLFQLSYQDVLAYEKGGRKDLFYLYYGKDKGFNTNEFNGGCEPCAARLQNGDISLPSLDGLVYFSPDSIQPELPDKPIFIDAAELDKQRLEVGSSITLPSGFHHLRLHVSTPYFGDPNNLRLYYSLVELGTRDSELWLELSDNKSIEFSSLHSGKYLLKIRKTANFGAGMTTEKQLVIHVQKAFYETFWFKALVTAILALLAFIYYRRRMDREKRKNYILEARVTERTHELREALENLRLSEQHLRKQGFIQQRLTAAMSHDLRTPLQYIMQVLGESGKQKTELDPEEIQIVYESLYNMFYLVENLIAYMKSLYTGDDSSLEVTDLHRLLEEKANIFRRLAAAKQVQIQNDTAPGCLALVNRQLLAIVVHNLVDNAVKYTRKGSIRLKAACDAKSIHIQFCDTGIGMPQPMIDWLNHYRPGISVTEQRPPSSDGIGLMMVVELLELINGSIAVRHNDDGGTVIDVILAVIE